MRTIGLWRKKLPIGSESMDWSPPPLTMNSKREKEKEKETQREKSMKVFINYAMDSAIKWVN